ncbi:hypothetical protein VTN96DRAFT_10022 [Rasamsonia emersonii]
MSQAEAFWAPGILDVCSDASSVACGHLSLHDYRKFLSQPEGIDLPDELKGRTLRRKPAASNLNQARTRQEFWFSLSSPLSSAPSSPPPLSYSQSVITLQSDNETQDSVSPLGRPLTTPASQTKQPKAFRETLSQNSSPIVDLSSHKRATSDSALLESKRPRTTIIHEGIPFEIINPRESLDVSNIISSPHRSSQVSRETMSSPNRPSTVRSARSILENLPDARVSASESLKFPSPSPGLLESEDPFSALPRLIDLPRRPSNLVTRPSVETTARSARKASPKTLTQKVSQLFGSSGETRGKLRKLFSPKSKSSEQKSLETLPRPESNAESYMAASMELSNMGQWSTDSGDIADTDNQPQNHCAQGRVELSSTVDEGDQYDQSATGPVEHVSNDSFYDAGSQEVPRESQDPQPVSENLVDTAPGDTTLANEDATDSIALVRRRPIPENAEYRANRYHTVVADENSSVLYQDIIGFLQFDQIQDDQDQNEEQDSEDSLSSVADRNLSDLPDLQRFPSAPSTETQGSQPSPTAPVRESTRASIRPYLQPVAAFMERGSVSSADSQSDVDNEEAEQEEVEHEEMDDEGEWEDVDEEEPDDEVTTEGNQRPSESFDAFGNCENAERAEEPSERPEEQEHYRLARYMTGSSVANITSHDSDKREQTPPENHIPELPGNTCQLSLTHRDSLLTHRMRYAKANCASGNEINSRRAFESPRFYANLCEWERQAFSYQSETNLHQNSGNKAKNARLHLKFSCCCTC